MQDGEIQICITKNSTEGTKTEKLLKKIIYKTVNK